MALKERYYTVDGQIVGYRKSGVRKDFLTDALGSVTAEVDQTGNTKSFDGRYQPYGGTLASTGTRGLYGWIGSWGYRDTGLSASSHYVRARHYSRTGGNWTSVDPLWPDEYPYIYAAENPTFYVDPDGMAFVDINMLCPGASNPCNGLDAASKPGSKQDQVLKCMRALGFDLAGDGDRIRKALIDMAGRCRNKPGSQGAACIISNPSPGDPCYPTWIFKCNGATGSTVLFKAPPNVNPPKGEGCSRIEPLGQNPCYLGAVGKGCPCIINNCSLDSKLFFESLYFHELAHCAGYGGGPDHERKNHLPPGMISYTPWAAAYAKSRLDTTTRIVRVAR